MSLPEGFEWLRSGRWEVALPTEQKEMLVAAGVTDPVALAERGTSSFRGRGRPVRVPLPDGGAGVLRRYLHGGALRGITGARFLGEPRPLRELRATEAARRAGVRVAEVLAAIHRRRAGLFHEGYLLTREVEDAVDLVEWLQGGREPGPLLRSLGEETRRMHEAGVWHADLHVKNVLVTAGRPVLIDFDRATVSTDLNESRRTRNLLRFDRSLVKLSREGPTVRMVDRLRFFAGYYGTRPDAEKRSELKTRCRRSLRWHRLWWKITP